MLHKFDSISRQRFAWLLGCLLLAFGRLAAFADQSVTLTWTPSPDTNAVGYKVYYGGASSVYTNSLIVGGATNVTVSGLSEGATYYFSATTVSAAGVESAFSNEASYAIPVNTNNFTSGPAPTSTNAPPTLDPIANVSIYENAGTQTINLTGLSPGSNNGVPLAISVVSSDPTIIPTPSVTYSSPASTGTLTFTPVANAFGTVTLQVTVDNGGASNNIVTQSFTVTLAAAPVVANPYPSINAISNVTVYENSGVQTIPLAGIASNSTNWNFVGIQAYTSDSTIIPAPTVNYTSPASTGTLTFQPVTNALGTATLTVTANNGVNNFSQSFTVTVVPAPVPAVAASQPPTLDALANVTIPANSGAHVVALTGLAAGLPNNNSTLTVSAISSNSAVIPAPVVNYSSPNASGTLTFAPATNATGTSVISVTVNNGNATNNVVTRTFVVTVLGNGSPTLDPIANVNVQEDAASQTITLTGISAGTSAGRQPLKITAASNNPRVVPAPSVHYVNGAATAVLTLRFNPNTSGQALVTVTVSNGGRSNNVCHQSFTVTVSPIPPPTLDPIANITVTTNSGLQMITLTGISAGSPIGSRVLKVSASSSNRRLLSPTITYTSPATTALLTFNPGSLTGVTTVAVTVSDGFRLNGLVRQAFTITVVAPAQSSTPAVATLSKSSAVPGQASPKPDIAVGDNVAATLTPVSSAAGQFSFAVTGVPSGQYVVQASRDMTNWIAIQTNTAPFTFQDTTQGSDRKFYRAYYQPPQGQ